MDEFGEAEGEVAEGDHDARTEGRIATAVLVS